MHRPYQGQGKGNVTLMVSPVMVLGLPGQGGDAVKVTASACAGVDCGEAEDVPVRRLLELHWRHVSTRKEMNGFWQRR